MKILVVDDEDVIRESIETKLRREGFTPFGARSAEEGMRLFRKVRPDLAILDIMLPHRSGLELCAAIRQESTMPIIFLSAKVDEASRIHGLECGADDYVGKPFSLQELAARVKAVLRRSGREPLPAIIEAGSLRIDTDRHEAHRDGQPLTLSPKEFDLLLFLASREGRVFSREVLIDRVWGADSGSTMRTVDVHVRRLRTRIEDDPDRPMHLVTVRGVGYKFVR